MGTQLRAEVPDHRANTAQAPKSSACGQKTWSGHVRESPTYTTNHWRLQQALMPCRNAGLRQDRCEACMQCCTSCARSGTFMHRPSAQLGCIAERTNLKKITAAQRLRGELISVALRFSGVKCSLATAMTPQEDDECALSRMVVFRRGVPVKSESASEQKESLTPLRTLAARLLFTGVPI